MRCQWVSFRRAGAGAAGGGAVAAAPGAPAVAGSQPGTEPLANRKAVMSTSAFTPIRLAAPSENSRRLTPPGTTLQCPGSGEKLPYDAPAWRSR